MRETKRLLSLALAILMVISLIPATSIPVLAAGDTIDDYYVVDDTDVDGTEKNSATDDHDIVSSPNSVDLEEETEAAQEEEAGVMAVGRALLNGLLTVTDINDLQDAIDSADDGDTIVLNIASPTTLPAALTINTSKSLTFYAENPLTLYPASGKRHISVSGSDVELNFTNIIMDGQNAGGGIESNASSLMLNGVTIENCRSTTEGGGGAVRAYSSLTILNGTFIGNEACGGNSGGYNGGAIYAHGALDISNSTFSENKTSTKGGAVYGYSSVNLEGSNFSKNKSVNNDGGAVYARGALTISNDTFNENEADGTGGAVHGYSSVTVEDSDFLRNKAANNSGGAIFSDSGITIKNNSTFNENEAGGRGGAVYGQSFVTVENSDFLRNKAGRGGGAIGTIGTLEISIVTFTENEATGDGGAVHCSRNYLTITASEFTDNVANGAGGAVYSDEAITIIGSEFTRNKADDGGAVLSASDITVTGGKFIGNEAKITGNYYGGAIYADGVINISGSSEFTGNKAGGSGGAVYGASTVTVTGGEFIGNGAGLGGASGGGAIYATGVLNISNGTFTENEAGSFGGAVRGASAITVSGSDFTGNKAGLRNNYGGGAIYAISTLDILADCTFTGNKTAGYGGAVHTNGTGNVTISDSELTDNEASWYGGAICIQNASVSLTVTNSTISNNQSGTNYFGGAIYAAGTVVIKNGSIISNNSAPSGVGGGIYILSYTNLKVGEDVEFSGNTAKIPLRLNLSLLDDVRAYYEANIKPYSLSSYMSGETETAFENLLNNYDVNYTGDSIIITYDANDDNEASGDPPVPQTVLKGQIVSAPGGGTMVRTDYTFKGWSSDPNAEEAVYAPDDDMAFRENVTLYAVWTASSYAITYIDHNGNDITDSLPLDYDDAKSYTYGTGVTIPTVTPYSRSSYTFDGWYDAETGGDKVTTISDTDTGNITLYARWTYRGGSTTTYKVTYNANGATSGAAPVDSTNYLTGTEATILDKGNLEKTNYTFTGWSTTATGGVKYEAGDNITITSNVTLYAVWEISVYNITYINHNGNNITNLLPSGYSGVKNYTYGTGVTIPNDTPYTRAGYTFNGWYDAQTDGNQVTSISNTDTGDKTLYAQWSYTGGSGRDPSNPYDDITIIGEGDVPLGSLLADHMVYIHGYPDGSVRADGNITRGEAAAIFYRILDDTNKTVPVAERFPDVSVEAWYGQSINYLASIGILNGDQDGMFKPNESISKAEFATIASKFDRLYLTTGTAFSDVPETHWAVQYINSAYIKGWIDGYSDYSFKPEQSITRAEVVSQVNVILNREIDSTALAKVENPYNDITTSHWAYGKIIEASLPHEYDWDEDGREYWLSR